MTKPLANVKPEMFRERLGVVNTFLVKRECKLYLCSLDCIVATASLQQSIQQQQWSSFNRFS